MTPRFPALALVSALSLPDVAAADAYSFAMADRLEYQHDGDVAVWDLQGWVGGDKHKFWWKTEGAFEQGEAEEAGIQLLYSRAISAYFDLQLGLRRDLRPLPSTNHAVVGLQGLAPQWFEVDAALFLSDDGDLSSYIELEYELFLTQRWVLQPRLEARLGTTAREEFGSGLQTVDLGLRLRYEIHRKFAPYLGIEWQRAYGGTAEILRAGGADPRRTSMVAGIRVWL